MAQRVRLAGVNALVTAAPHVVRHRQRRAAIQQDLDDLVVVAMGGQNQWRYVRRVRRRRTIDRFPGLVSEFSGVSELLIGDTNPLLWCITYIRLTGLVVLLLPIKQRFHGLHVLLVNGMQQGVLFGCGFDNHADKYVKP